MMINTMCFNLYIIRFFIYDRLNYGIIINNLLTATC